MQVALPGTQVPGADIACFLPRASPALPLSGVYARASALSPAGNRLPVTIGHREDPRQQLCAVQSCCAALPPVVRWLLVRTLDSALRGASTLPAASNRNPSGFVDRGSSWTDRNVTEAFSRSQPVFPRESSAPCTALPENYLSSYGPGIFFICRRGRGERVQDFVDR